MSKKKIQPKIRFKEFDNSWKKPKFKLFISKAGKKNSANNDFPAYSVSNKVGLIPQNEQFEGSRLDFLEKIAYKIVNPKEFAYNPARINVGSIGFNDLGFPVLVSSLYVVIKINEKLNNDYVLQYIKSPEFIKEVKRNTEGSVREYLFFESLKNVKLPYTELIAEQIQIASFFKKLDEMIHLQQQYLDNYKQLKKVMLQRMFPKNNDKIPKIRFNEYINAWEQCKLGDIVKITMGQSPNSENYTETPTDYILVQGNADMKNNRVVPRVWTTQVTKMADKGDLILSVRAPVGDIGKTDYDVVLGRGVASIRGNEFIFQTLRRMKENRFWTKLSTGSTFESINSSDIKDASILLPIEDEQNKIGTFFRQFDNTINLHQSKLDSYKELKKAMLQRMFI